jgi:hypothetical protein
MFNIFALLTEYTTEEQHTIIKFCCQSHLLKIGHNSTAECSPFELTERLTWGWARNLLLKMIFFVMPFNVVFNIANIASEMRISIDRNFGVMTEVSTENILF